MGLVIGATFAAVVVYFPDYIENSSHQWCYDYKTGEKENCYWLVRAINDPIAVFSALVSVLTAALVGSTIMLWLETKRLAEGAEDQAKLTRESIVLQHRPRLRVHNIEIHDRRPHKQRFPLFMDGQLVTGTLRVINIGGSAAQITASYCTVYWSEFGLPMRPPYRGHPPNHLISIGRLIPGEAREGFFSSSEAMDNKGGTVATDIVGRLHLYVMGWIEYLDELGILRRIEFCRECRRLTPVREMRFYRVDDPDYENEGY
jgi:hypothetical protein